MSKLDTLPIEEAKHHISKSFSENSEPEVIDLT